MSIIRTLDIILAIIALICLSPLFFLVIVLLAFTGERKIIFTQARIGKNLREFNVIKFVTMQENSEKIGTGTITMRNDPRILPLGRFLRASKINELPQLINVLLGEMSLIGSRPLTHQSLPSLPVGELESILSVPPGLSGIASIILYNEEEILPSGDQGLIFYRDVIAPYKAALDLWYSRNRTPLVYLFLIAATILRLTLREKFDIYKFLINLPKRPIDLKVQPEDLTP